MINAIGAACLFASMVVIGIGSIWLMAMILKDLEQH